MNKVSSHSSRRNQVRYDSIQYSMPFTECSSRTMRRDLLKLGGSRIKQRRRLIALHSYIQCSLRLHTPQ